MDKPPARPAPVALLVRHAVTTVLPVTVGVTLARRADPVRPPSRPDGAVGVTAQVIAHHEPAQRVDAVEHLLELEPQQPAVLAELDQVDLDLVGDPVQQLGRLEHRHHVAHRHGVGDLECGQRRQRGVESLAEPHGWSAGPGAPARAGAARPGGHGACRVGRR